MVKYPKLDSGLLTDGYIIRSAVCSVPISMVQCVLPLGVCLNACSVSYCFSMSRCVHRVFLLRACLTAQLGCASLCLACVSVTGVWSSLRCVSRLEVCLTALSVTSSDDAGGGGSGGGFFLACEDLGRMLGHAFPGCCCLFVFGLLLLFFKWKSARSR